LLSRQARYRIPRALQAAKRWICISDIVALRAFVDGAQIQDQVFAAEPFGVQVRVDKLDFDDRRFVATHDVDQVDQQFRFFGEDAEEDVIVLGVLAFM
jgi:hypothetical protein